MTPRLDWAGDGGERGKRSGGGEAGLQLKTAKFSLSCSPWPVDSEGGQIDSHPSYNAAPSTLVVLPLGVAHRIYQGHIYGQDGTSHPPHSAVAATILPHYIDKETSVAEPPSCSL